MHGWLIDPIIHDLVCLIDWLIDSITGSDATMLRRAKATTRPISAIRRVAESFTIILARRARAIRRTLSLSATGAQGSSRRTLERLYTSTGDARPINSRPRIRRYDNYPKGEWSTTSMVRIPHWAAENEVMSPGQWRAIARKDKNKSGKYSSVGMTRTLNKLLWG